MDVKIEKPVRTWHGAIPAELAERARHLAGEVAERIDDGDRVLDLIVTSAEQAEHPMGWYYPSFGQGHAGLALLPLHAARQAVGARREALRQSAFGLLREAFGATRAEPLDGPGVFAGMSGLALVLSEAVEAEPRFGPSLVRLHEQLAERVTSWDLPRVERGVADQHYDMISGAAGALAYISGVADPGERLGQAAEILVDHLIWLGGTPDDPVLPWRFLIAPEMLPEQVRDRSGYEGGYLNLGMSHGVPGVIAALAGAWRAGLRRPGHEEVLREMTRWVLEVRKNDSHGPLWTGDVPVGIPPARTGDTVLRDQLAWCYGTAGVSAALLTVADALGDDEVRTVAVEGYEAVLQRTREFPVLSPTLCHGLAGLLVICLEFAATTNSELAREFVPVLLAEVMDYAAPDRPLVFADEDRPGNLVDSPSLLNGAPGVALSLLAATAQRRPAWFRAFLAR
ncbi:lanthionine synthetase C family protein [Micromonospora sp. DT53]|uniref:lanthionine synthetase C family protein n=1 Tax=Micromonospora sp. DT53 TaxID=3393444 RepID=UPI003CF5C1AB